MDESTQMSQPQNDLFNSAADEQVVQEEYQEEIPQEIPESQEPEEDFSDWNKEKSIAAYRAQQSEKDKAAKAARIAEENRIRAEERARLLEEQLNSFKQPVQKQQIPEKPVLPPKPANFNQADLYNEDTLTGQWFIAKTDYDYKKAAYDEYFQNSIETDRQKTAEAKRAETEFLKMKNYRIAEFQKVPGVTLQEAMEAFDFINSEDSLKNENVINYLRSTKSKRAKPVGQRPGETQFASTVPGHDEPKPDDVKDFMASFSRAGANIFETNK